MTGETASFTSIERFKLKAEWFRREELYNLYENNTSSENATLIGSCGLRLFSRRRS